MGVDPGLGGLEKHQAEQDAEFARLEALRLEAEAKEREEQENG